MLQAFRDMQQELLRLVGDHEALCALDQPEVRDVGSVRWRLAQCGRARARMMADDILPRVEACCTSDEGARVLSFRAGVLEYQRGISAHVARWPTATIIADWAGYREGAAAFRRTVRARVAEETALLNPILERADQHGMGPFRDEPEPFLSLIRTRSSAACGGSADSFRLSAGASAARPRR